MSRLGMQIELKGKLFELEKIEQRTKDLINQGIRLMAFQTEKRVKVKTPRVTGHLQGSVAGELIRDFFAQVDAGANLMGANVVYASWIEGTSERNEASTYKGVHMFRQAYDTLDAEDKDKYFAVAIRKNLE